MSTVQLHVTEDYQEAAEASPDDCDPGRAL